MPDNSPFFKYSSAAYNVADRAHGRLAYCQGIDASDPTDVAAAYVAKVRRAESIRARALTRVQFAK